MSLKMAIALAALLLATGVLAGNALAAPSVYSVIGTVVHQGVVTIQGSGFGTKPTPAPYRWDDFDSGTPGTRLPDEAQGGWYTMAMQAGKWPTYNADRVRWAGSQSAYQDFTGGNSNSTIALRDLPDVPRYFSGWFYMTTSGSPSSIVKLLEARAGYLPSWRGSISQFPLANSGIQYVNDCDGHSLYTNWSIGGDLMTDSWHRLEYWLDQGTVGNGDGIWTVWIDGQLRTQVSGSFLPLADCPITSLYVAPSFATDTGTPQPSAQRYWDELYVDFTRSRVEIGDAATWSSCTHREIQVPATWSASAIAVTINKGSFLDGRQVYVYVVDEDGSVNQQGFPVVLDGEPAGDTTPPFAVTNLAMGTPTATSLTLTWTAVGDDGNTGTATTYDLRYSTSAITAANFASATAVTGEPVPLVAGTPQSMTVTGLSSSTTYYFALKVADEVPNWSVISNLPSGTTSPPSDTTPPSAVANLAVGTPTTTSVPLTWTAVGDDGSTGTATTYDLRYSTSAITAANFAAATAVTGEPAPHVAGTAESMTVTGLSSSTTYYFALKVADEVPNWSLISNLPGGVMTLPPPDTTPPAAVTTLAVGTPLPTLLMLTWTAVGDDGNTGTATTYDLRYSTSAIDASNFTSATAVTGEPTPHVAGTAESLVVTGLAPNTTYYFAMKVADEVPNWSAISNLPHGTTLPPSDITPPSAVSNLAVGTPTSNSLLLTWTAVGDDGNTGTATTYNLRYSTSAITAANFDAATPVTSGVPALHVAGTPESMTVSGLASNTSYYFALKVADEVPNWSLISNLPSRTTLPAPDTTPPSAVSTLAVGAPAPTSVTLTWTAVGDDGNTGTATTYNLRYSTSAITAANFDAATPVTSGVPAPHVAGTPESMTVTGLSSSTTYCFALKVADEVPNWSALSNVPSGATSPPPTGSCCAPDGNCTVTTQANCTGTWTGAGVCVPNPCVPTTGACCFRNAYCRIVTPARCLALRGVFVGGVCAASDNPRCYVSGGPQGSSQPPDSTMTEPPLGTPSLAVEIIPNPGTTQCDVRFTLSRATAATVEVFDLAGARVRVLSREPRGAGKQTVAWDGQSDDGHVLPAGVYFVRVTTAQESASERVVLTR